MSARARGKKEFLETNRVVHDLVLGIDDEDTLGGVVSPDERMKRARLLNMRCQPLEVEKHWGRTRTGAGAGP